MRNRLPFIFICIFLFSCSMQEGDFHKESQRIDLDTSKVYSYKSETFDVSISYQISNDHFVFTKKDSIFKASLSSTIQIYNSDKDSIVSQEFWVDSIVEPLYNETRSYKKFYAFKKTVSLPEGEYQIKINIKDLDSGNLFKSKENLSLSTSDGFGTVNIFRSDSSWNRGLQVLDYNGKYELDGNFNTISFQFFQDDTSISEVRVVVESIQSKHEVVFSDVPIDNSGFYSLDIEIPDSFYNKFNLSLICLDDSWTSEFYLSHPKNKFWTSDVDEIVETMRYILSASDIKSLKTMPVNEKLEYISNYWSEIDPTPESDENELLDEFKSRVEFSNLNFSNLSKGYRSDRGRVYIIYGPPESVEKISNYDGVYQVWNYTSGSSFVFIDRNGFGNFILVRQTL